MSVYCGNMFGGGQGYADVCGKEIYGKGTPLAQCAGCMKTEIGQLKAENHSLRKFIIGLAESDAEIAYAYAAISSPEYP